MSSFGKAAVSQWKETETDTEIETESNGFSCGFSFWCVVVLSQRSEIEKKLNFLSFSWQYRYRNTRYWNLGPILHSLNEEQQWIILLYNFTSICCILVSRDRFNVCTCTYFHHYTCMSISMERRVDTSIIHVLYMWYIPSICNI